MTAQPFKVTLSQRKALATGQTFLVAGLQGQVDFVTDLDWADLINPNVPKTICRTCGRILPVTCFQASESPGGSTGKSRHPDCVICESNAEDAKRREHVWEHRAKAVLLHHMRVERTQGLHQCTKLEHYIRLTGVTIEWLAAKMRRAWEDDEACDHCETAGLPAHWQQIVPDPLNDYRQLSRMTVDRTDRNRLLARDNLTLMCLPGNIAKGKTDPATYADRQAYWRLHNHATGGATPARG